MEKEEVPLHRIEEGPKDREEKEKKKPAWAQERRRGGGKILEKVLDWNDGSRSRSTTKRERGSSSVEDRGIRQEVPAWAKECGGGDTPHNSNGTERKQQSMPSERKSMVETIDLCTSSDNDDEEEREVEEEEPSVRKDVEEKKSVGSKNRNEQNVSNTAENERKTQVDNNGLKEKQTRTEKDIDHVVEGNDVQKNTATAEVSHPNAPQGNKNGEEKNLQSNVQENLYSLQPKPPAAELSHQNAQVDKSGVAAGNDAQRKVASTEDVSIQENAEIDEIGVEENRQNNQSRIVEKNVRDIVRDTDAQQKATMDEAKKNGVLEETNLESKNNRHEDVDTNVAERKTTIAELSPQNTQIDGSGSAEVNLQNNAEKNLNEIVGTNEARRTTGTVEDRHQNTQSDESGTGENLQRNVGENLHVTQERADTEEVSHQNAQITERGLEDDAHYLQEGIGENKAQRKTFTVEAGTHTGSGIRENARGQSRTEKYLHEDVGTHRKAHELINSHDVKLNERGPGTDQSQDKKINSERISLVDS